MATSLLIGVLIAVLVGLALLIWALWRQIDMVRRHVAHLTEVVSAAPRSTPPEDSISIQRIHEDPLPTSEAAITFWRKVHAMPEWKTLSHIFQSETRTALREGEQACADDNQTLALSCLGRAKALAFLAVRPEWEVQRITKALLAQHREAELDSSMTGGGAGGGARPGARWGPEGPEA